jgi:hypothetical protein
MIARLEALKAFAAEKQALQDGINQMTMTELQHKLWANEQERAAEEHRIPESQEWTAAQKEELLAQLDDYYAKKKKMAEKDASGWTELVENTKSAVTNTLGSLFSTTLDAFAQQYNRADYPWSPFRFNVNGFDSWGATSPKAMARRRQLIDRAIAAIGMEGNMLGWGNELVHPDDSKGDTPACTRRRRSSSGGSRWRSTAGTSGGQM